MRLRSRSVRFISAVAPRHHFQGIGSGLGLRRTSWSGLSAEIRRGARRTLKAGFAECRVVGPGFLAAIGVVHHDPSWHLVAEHLLCLAFEAGLDLLRLVY